MKNTLLLIMASTTLAAAVSLVACGKKETPKVEAPAPAASAPAASAPAAPASIPGVPTTDGTLAPAPAPAAIPGVPTTPASEPKAEDKTPTTTKKTNG